MHVWLCVSGVLQDYYDEPPHSALRSDTFARQWRAALRGAAPHGELYCLEWESEQLRALGNALHHFLHTQAATHAASKAYGSTVCMRVCMSLICTYIHT
jgi:hypothetical protein